MVAPREKNPLLYFLCVQHYLQSRTQVFSLHTTTTFLCVTKPATDTVILWLVGEREGRRRKLVVISPPPPSRLPLPRRSSEMALTEEVDGGGLWFFPSFNFPSATAASSKVPPLHRESLVMYGPIFGCSSTPLVALTSPQVEAESVSIRPIFFAFLG